MGYIDQSLIEGEAILHRGRMSWWSQFWLVLLGVLTLVAVIGLVFIIWAWVTMRSTEVAITNRRVLELPWHGRRTGRLTLRVRSGSPVIDGIALRSYKR